MVRTYYLLKELRDSDGMIQLGRLADAVTTNVSQKAPQMKMRKKQTPSTNATSTIEDRWRMLRL